MKKIIIILFIASTAVPVVFCQDMSKLLSEQDFISIVKKYHPVIRQADINIQKAKADITIARGGFDPSLYLHNDQKTFDGKNYYNYTNPELKIPTWYGIEVKAGFENNGGQLERR